MALVVGELRAGERERRVGDISRGRPLVLYAAEAAGSLARRRAGVYREGPYLRQPFLNRIRRCLPAAIKNRLYLFKASSVPN